MTTDLATYVQDMIARKLTHEFHQSEMKSFDGCRRRWNWVFIENYYPPMTPKPLEFGIAFHKCMEVLHNPDTWSFNHQVLGALAEKAFVDECKRQKHEYLRYRDKYALEGSEEEDYEERFALGRGMIGYYVKAQLPKMQELYVPITVETSFDVPLMDEGKFLLCKCKLCRKAFAKAGGGNWLGSPVVYSGRVDIVMRDMRGDYWILDWKTAAALRDIEDYLELDIQISSYVMALRRKLRLNIVGFLYFELRKAFPEPPRMNSAPRLGRWFSVNRQQATDYDTYLKTIKEEDAEGYESGAYEDFLMYLKASGPTFFRTIPVYKSDYELEDTEREIIMRVREMVNPNVSIYRSPGQFHCSGCAFKLPCKMKSAGEDYQYTLDTLYEKREPYYRLREQKFSTESKGAQ